MLMIWADRHLRLSSWPLLRTSWRDDPSPCVYDLRSTCLCRRAYLALPLPQFNSGIYLARAAGSTVIPAPEESAQRITLCGRWLFFYVADIKWLPRTLESVTERPVDLMAHFNALVESPCGDHATALFETVRDFRDWGVSDLEAYTWFMTDVEWSWMPDSTPIEDW